MRSNCLLYALSVWWRAPSGSSLSFRRSYYGPFPHFAVLIEDAAGNMTRREFAPDAPRYRRKPPLLFYGHEVITHYRKD